MDLRRFKRLPKGNQLDYLSCYGVSTGLFYERRGSRYLLFLLHDFYVEILEKESEDYFFTLKIYQSLKKIEPFLKQIDLSDVYGLLSE